MQAQQHCQVSCAPSSRVPRRLLVLLLDREPSCEGRLAGPAPGGAGEGGGSGGPCPLAALAALLRDTLMGEMPSARAHCA